MSELNQSASEQAAASERPLRVLFLCTHNSARSQMAEWTLRHVGGARFEVSSAGTEATQVHPLAIRVMAAAGISMEGARSKHLDEFIDQEFDYIITVCDRANESCPVFPGQVTRLHWSFPDPSAATGSDASRLRVFEQTRREITQRIRVWMLAIDGPRARETSATS